MTALTTRPLRARPASSHAATSLVALVGVLVAFGLLMVLSSSSVQALREAGSSWLYFQRQVVWVALGIAAMTFTARVDYRAWRPFAVPLLALVSLLLVVVLVPGVGVSVNGSRRWLDLGPVQVQPSELAKLAVLLFVADLMARRADRVHEVAAVLRPVLLVLVTTASLVMIQPDMGTTAVIAGIVAALLFVGGIPLAWMGALAGVGTAASVVLGLVEPYRRARLLSFLDPWADASHTGYQVVQSLVGMGSGQVTGVGLGASRAKWGFLPNAHTDFIFAIIGEELGLLGSVAVLLLFGLFAFLGVRTAMRAPDRFGALVAAGLTAWIVGQGLVNVGAVVGVLPVTGVPLPFISSGGSALLVTMAATGVLVSVARAVDASAPRRRRLVTTSP